MQLSIHGPVWGVLKKLFIFREQLCRKYSDKALLVISLSLLDYFHYRFLSFDLKLLYRL
jgi:hypothetical protein